MIVQRPFLALWKDGCNIYQKKKKSTRVPHKLALPVSIWGLDFTTGFQITESVPLEEKKMLLRVNFIASHPH